MEKTIEYQRALDAVVEKLRESVLDTIKKSGFVFFRRSNEKNIYTVERRDKNMGFLNLGKGKDQIRDKCVRDPESGNVVCKRTRIHPDKSETIIAEFTMTTDASCNVVPDNESETEEGALADLEKKFVHKMIGKCKNSPQDF
jgi:hypothetical protein